MTLTLHKSVRAAGKQLNPWTLAALVVLGFAVFLVWRVLAAGNPLEVTVANSSYSQITGLALVSRSGFRAEIPKLGAGESVTLRPRTGGENDSLVLVDAQHREYEVLGGFEGDQGGQVTVVIRSAPASGLKGRVVDGSDYFASGESALKQLSP